MIKWFKRLFRLDTVKFHGVRIPANFKRACPGNAAGVYWEMPDGTYWFSVCTGVKSEVTQRDYERGTWFKAMMEVGEEF